jgi:hypothetical protein
MNKIINIRNFLILINLYFITNGFSQNYKHELRYQPYENGFLIKNGTRKFNRALYGTNTAFRIETGDLPEFALFTGDMGGNIKFGIFNKDKSKWITQFDSIEAQYIPGRMFYTLKDQIISGGYIKLTVFAMSDAEGLIIKAELNNLPENTELLFVYGGASGKRMRRNGDLNVDPENVFYLLPENCLNNIYEIKDNTFILHYGNGIIRPKNINNESSDKNVNYKKQLFGILPNKSSIKLCDANKLNNPANLWSSANNQMPVIAAKLNNISNSVEYFCVFNPLTKDYNSNESLAEIFLRAKIVADNLLNRIVIETPDAFINTLGGTITAAADAIWESPTYLHGAIGWRMRLPGWRGPYAADPLGWHDRAKEHFYSYSLSQVLEPDSGPSIPDPKNNLARQEEKMGNSLYTKGYICRNPNGDIRPHHYDMNLIYIDGLLRHFKWTGDTSFIKQMWPVIKRHLEWEKRCFDANNDGLYDAYCCIWASDALEYSGGGVTHSSAYNYYANLLAEEIASLIGEDPEPYLQEAEKIKKAIDSKLWLNQKGTYAEYIDLLGLQQQHPSAALWTIYHAIDSKVPNIFQAYQATKYIDNEIPHINFKVNNSDENFYVLSTTNWMPYTWSINNVVMAENIHTALAYWQTNRNDEAFKLFKSTILDAMYCGASPGNFAQTSFFDPELGETYRDFADEIGITARTIVEGLFGIEPFALSDYIYIKPGLPSYWNNASISTPDFNFKFERNDDKETYIFEQNHQKLMFLKFAIPAYKSQIKSIKINNQQTSWYNIEDDIMLPRIGIDFNKEKICTLEIEWAGNKVFNNNKNMTIVPDEQFRINFDNANISGIYDPQGAAYNTTFENNILTAKATKISGFYTIFVKLQQDELIWWYPINIEIKKPFEIFSSDTTKNSIKLFIKNNTNRNVKLKLYINKEINPFKTINIKANQISKEIIVGQNHLLPGRNKLILTENNILICDTNIVTWNIDMPEKIIIYNADLNEYYNDRITNIFKNEYLEPRCPYPTLQIPKNGIGNWCSTIVEPIIDDRGLLKIADNKKIIKFPNGLTFKISDDTLKNIIFTSLWKNYPDSFSLPLEGCYAHAYFLMTGTTNHMQSRITNAIIKIEYADGTCEKLELKNPDTWWPIEQDYFTDGKSFYLTEPRPLRIHLKTGKVTHTYSANSSIQGFSKHIIEGGAATVYDMPLDITKRLKQIKFITQSNEVIIGLIGMSLVK